MPKPDSRHVFLMVDALAHEFFTPPDPNFDDTKFDFDKDPARMAWFSARWISPVGPSGRSRPQVVIRG
jgi:hypothetical protein